MLRFETLELKYGASFAYSLLLQIEKAAQISSQDKVNLDPERRLEIALHAQDALFNGAPLLAA